METLTWLHLSDLHYCAPRTGWDAGRVLQALTEDLTFLEAEYGLCPDMIFFTGDLAFGNMGDAKGKNLIDQYRGVDAFLDAVRTAFKTPVRKTDIFLVPGNHDVDRKQVTRMQTAWLDSVEDDADIIRIIHEKGQEWKDFIRRLDAYRGFLETFGYDHLLADDPDRLIYAIKRNIGGVSIGIAGFNTAWACARQSREEKGKLRMASRWQLQTLVDGLKETDIRIGLMHHPPDWFVETEDRRFAIALQEHFTFCLHGHEHNEWITRLDTGHTMISAGACYGGLDEDTGYSMVNIDFSTGDARVWMRRFYDKGKGAWGPEILPGKTDEREKGIWHLPNLAGGIASAGSEGSQNQSDPVAAYGRLNEPGSKTSVGNGSAAVIGHGNIVIPGSHNQVTIESHPPEDDHAYLKTDYLTRLFDGICDLQLSGIDHKLAVEADACLDLSSVYTALLTHQFKDRELRNVTAFAKEQQVSALSMLDEHQHLVLLGDPGSGKTTFINFVTLCLAGAALGKKDVNLKMLTRPLPDDQGKDGDKPQPWHKDVLVPVRVVLRDFVSSALPENGKATAACLWEYIVKQLTEDKLEAYAPWLERELRQHGGLIMLDGLDEVPEANRRREQVKQVVEGFSSAWHKCRILVTSRTYAYQDPDWRLSGFAVAAIAPFSSGQIRRFVDQWYAHMVMLRGMSAGNASVRAELLKKAIFGKKRLLELARRPLLLTLMASLHAWREGNLPDERHLLYADTVDLLLERWVDKKIERNPDGSPVTVEPALTEWLGVDKGQLRQVLEQLAYDVHCKQGADQGRTADISETELIGRLMDLSPKRDIRPGLLVRFLSDRVGILASRGKNTKKQEVYAFPHRTFQEYLAACYLTNQETYPDCLAELARAAPNQWREVTLLAGAKSTHGMRAAVWMHVDSLCPNRHDAENTDDRDAWGAILAGQLLLESADLSTISSPNREKCHRIRDWMMEIMKKDDFPPVERALAGRILAILEDPRKNVMTIEHMNFCRVPEGTFSMGSDKNDDKHARDDETPRHDLFLPLYYMARYPVTNAQYQEFVDAGGYDNAEYWREAENHGEWKNGKVKTWLDNKERSAPYDFGRPFNLPNHPVVGVTWYEAMAFARWLDEKWHKENVLLDKWTVALPTEAQWEKAARGGFEIPASEMIVEPPGLKNTENIKDHLIENDLPNRIYPWSDDADVNRANVKGSEIDTTSAVGCFESGRSVFGCEEMSGNVMEWTRSLYKPYKYVADDGREDLKNVSRTTSMVLRGGGFWNNINEYPRCGCRVRLSPDYLNVAGGFRLSLSPFL